MSFVDLTSRVLECDCGDPHHLMQVILDEEPPRLWVNMQLNPMAPWYRRVWYALLYILGRRSRFGFGHWDSGSISEDGAGTLQLMLKTYLAACQAARPTEGWDPRTQTVTSRRFP